VVPIDLRIPDKGAPRLISGPRAPRRRKRFGPHEDNHNDADPASTSSKKPAPGVRPACGRNE